MAGAAGPTKAKRSLGRRAAGFALAFAISLAVGRFFEEVASERVLAGAHRAQAGWIAALSDFSPFALADTFGDKLYEDQMSRAGGTYIDADGRLARRPASGTLQDGLAAPMKAFFATVGALVAAGGVVGLAQLAMGALAVALIFRYRTKLGVGGMPPIAAFFLLPIAVIFAACLIAFALKSLMLGALAALSWATGLAASAAGATGVAGFCWYAIAKLGEKGAERALTPKI